MAAIHWAIVQTKPQRRKAEMSKIIDTYLCFGGELDGQRFHKEEDSFQIVKCEPYNWTSPADDNAAPVLERETYTRRIWNDYKNDRKYTLFALDKMSEEDAFAAFLSFILNEFVQPVMRAVK